MQNQRNLNLAASFVVNVDRILDGWSADGKCHRSLQWEFIRHMDKNPQEFIRILRSALLDASDAFNELVFEVEKVDYDKFFEELVAMCQFKERNRYACGDNFLSKTSDKGVVEREFRLFKYPSRLFGGHEDDYARIMAERMAAKGFRPAQPLEFLNFTANHLNEAYGHMYCCLALDCSGEVAMFIIKYHESESHSLSLSSLPCKNNHWPLDAWVLGIK